jgi:uncharacterized protein (TIGR01777 family)
MNVKRIVLAGGSGFIGRSLAKALLVRGYEVVILTRSPRENTGLMEMEWDGAHIGEWIKHLNGAEAVVNLAGRNINCPHKPENIDKILESRVNSVNAIAKSLAHVNVPPRVWVQAGATGFYGDTKDRLCDESSPAGNDTLAGVCKLWEDSFNSSDTRKTRRALLRIGFVLGRDGGALPVLSRLTKWFLGGSAGSGRQFISWIHTMDLMRMFIAAIERVDLSGTFNAVAPHPATNKEFMRELRRAWHRPWSPPAPELAVRLGARLMGSEASLALTSQCCAPIRFLESGFEFQFQELRAALEDLCRD